LTPCNKEAGRSDAVSEHYSFALSPLDLFQPLPCLQLFAAKPSHTQPAVKAKAKAKAKALLRGASGYCYTSITVSLVDC
jgi:hypothetical protein